MTGPFIRILLRYGSGFLVAKGLMSAEDATSLITDPDVELIIGSAMAVIAEGAYYLASKYGWAK